jgi:hypothetical protein
MKHYSLVAFIPLSENYRLHIIIALPSHVANSLVSLTRVWSSFKEVKNTWHHKYEIGNKPCKRIGNAHLIRLLLYFPKF